MKTFYSENVRRAHLWKRTCKLARFRRDTIVLVISLLLNRNFISSEAQNCHRNRPISSCLVLSDLPTKFLGPFLYLFRTDRRYLPTALVLRTMTRLSRLIRYFQSISMLLMCFELVLLVVHNILYSPLRVGCCLS